MFVQLDSLFVLDHVGSHHVEMVAHTLTILSEVMNVSIYVI